MAIGKNKTDRCPRCKQVIRRVKTPVLHEGKPVYTSLFECVRCKLLWNEEYLYGFWSGYRAAKEKA